MMKAAVVKEPGDLAVQEIPRPEIGEYDILCQMLYGATCTGTDRHLIRGSFPYGCAYPVILGHESIGQAVACGGRVRHFREGDLVTRVSALPVPAIGLGVSWGGFAEYGVARDHWAMRADGLPAFEWGAFRVNQPLPSHFDPLDATMIITWRETLSYITRLGVQPGSRILIFGSGANGLSFANHAANAGAEAVCMAGSFSRQEAALQVGATAFADYKTASAGQLAALSPGGFDIIIDATGRNGNADLYMPLLKPGGTLGVYGIDDLRSYVLNPNLARGGFTFFNGGYDEEETHARVVDAIRTRRLRAGDYLDRRAVWDLEDIGEAFRALEERRFIKAVIRLSGE
ncbi:MAG: zinc-binding dehydrogenase [Armatimonadetes bacterium]|nr:zinc-binding dehydrogenase [Armatimonadota bacterium]